MKVGKVKSVKAISEILKGRLKTRHLNFMNQKIKARLFNKLRAFCLNICHIALLLIHRDKNWHWPRSISFKHKIILTRLNYKQYLSLSLSLGMIEIGGVN